MIVHAFHTLCLSICGLRKRLKVAKCVESLVRVLETKANSLPRKVMTIQLRILNFFLEFSSLYKNLVEF